MTHLVARRRTGTVEVRTTSPSSPLTLSEPDTLDLIAYRGDTGRFRVSVVDGVGAPVNVSGATWDCDIRAAIDNPAAVGSMTITSINTNTIEVSLLATVSEDLPGVAFWDLQMTLTGEVKTLLAGKITTTPDVSS